MGFLQKTKTAVLRWLRWTAIYVRDFSRWVWQPHIAKFLFLAAVVLIALLNIYSDCLEQQIRLSGMALQLLGVLTLMVGLRDSRKAFEDEPTTWESFKNWWAGRPRFGPRHLIMAAAGLAMGVSTMSGRGRGGPGPDWTLEQRMDMLERQYGTLFDEVGRLNDETKQAVEELSKALDIERKAREEGDTNVREQLKKAIAEGFPLQLIGIVFFFTGIVAATASPEIAGVFGQGSCASP